jgi:hypothetical protein
MKPWCVSSVQSLCSLAEVEDEHYELKSHDYIDQAQTSLMDKLFGQQFKESLLSQGTGSVVYDD